MCVHICVHISFSNSQYLITATNNKNAISLITIWIMEGFIIGISIGLCIFAVTTTVVLICRRKKNNRYPGQVVSGCLMLFHDIIRMNHFFLFKFFY